MIKKHQKQSIHGNYQKTSLKQLLRKNFGPAKENPNAEENLQVLLIKLITINYWSNQMERSIAVVKIFLL